MDARRSLLTWVKGEKKDSPLFDAMLRKLAGEAYPHAEVVHVVLDNYRVHSSGIAKAAVAEQGGLVVLHFLPPYCPDDNKIERVWLDLHAIALKTVHHEMVKLGWARSHINPQVGGSAAASSGCTPPPARRHRTMASAGPSTWSSSECPFPTPRGKRVFLGALTAVLRPEARPAKRSRLPCGRRCL